VVATLLVDAALIGLHFILLNATGKDILPLPAAILLGAIASATAPAATLMVVRQYKAKGPLTSILLPIVALDDAVGLVLFAVSAGIAKAIISDGGISVTAHKNGRMIDGNDAGGGEGPFTPTRMGTMAVTDIIGALGDRTHAELKALCSQAGGFTSHFGTSNSDIIHAMVEQGDPRATRVWQAMIYQVCKTIGSMAVALEGKVDGIVLTGGLLRFDDVLADIRRRCEWIAPVTAYPGEFEQEAMAAGAMRVLTGEEEALTYSGKPVWNGFEDEQ
jgi:hypothetical protein